MTWALRVEPEAEADVLAAAEWYEARRVGLGADFVGAFAACLAAISEAPARHAQVQGYDAFRRARMPRFPYHVIFRVDDSERAAVVVAVAHGRRDPDHWVTR